jgi:gliding motility-associated-like protein
MKIFIAFFSLLLIPFSAFCQPQAGFIYDDSICVGDCITFQDTSLDAITNWVWTFNGGTPLNAIGQDPGVICYNTPGVYSVDLSVQGPGGVSNTSQTILVGSYPDSTIVSNDTLIDMGGSAFVAAAGYAAGGTYLWTPSQYFDCPTCPETIASPLVPILAIVQYISPTGCAIMDTVVIGINFKDLIDVPNSFSPNDDGINDKVFLKGPGIVTMTFRIFDRYGRKLFETSDQAEGWDGTFNGTELLPATYVWTAEYSLIGGLTDVKSGTITLIK